MPATRRRNIRVTLYGTPSGDYTWAMFELIDKARPGAFATLEAKAQKIEVIPIPEEYAAGPEYGMAVVSFDKPADVALAFAILSPEGQAVLKRFGFAPVGLQAKP
jgi:molybdate transport system substrate-binding protein